ncbi:MAG: universal stress protein [Burkholderiales bacterium RIFCSPLOWO2_02_FULL_57_36]|nr:MAG: universal stress protein [Burkholderiales bacterium RIFCSPLOWO2_02_FULL_57_36]
MPYETILVHVDHSKHAAARIKIAAEMAVEENAHLIGAAMTGLSRYLYEENTIELNRTVIANHVDFLHQQADESLAQFEQIARQAGVLSVERRLVNDDNQGGLTLQARYCDLVVLGQTDMDEPSARVISDLPEYVVLNSGRPVLIVPYAGVFKTVGQRVLVAWDGRMESTRAVSDAIPLLRRASNVAIALFNPSSGADAHGEQPGADIALFLARHDVKVEVMQQATSIDVGNALLSLAADLNSDLIVMGGYGHTRFREVLLGGVTKTVLATMTVPVLMSH